MSVVYIKNLSLLTEKSLQTQKKRKPSQCSPASPSTIYYNPALKKVPRINRCPTLHCDGIGNLNGVNQKHFVEKNCPNVISKENANVEDAFLNIKHLVNDAYENDKKTRRRNASLEKKLREVEANLNESTSQMEKIKSDLMTNRDSLEEINRECKMDSEEKEVIKN